jgi:hypothetical protein
MSKLESIIISFPMTIITRVILVGGVGQYHKLYILGNSRKAVKVKLTTGINKNFRVVEKSSIPPTGQFVQTLLPKSVLDLLMDDSYLNGTFPPDKELLEVLKYIFDLHNLYDIKSKQDKNSFSFWLFKQIARDDYVGDLVSNLKRDYFFCGIETDNQISEWVKEISTRSFWEINTIKKVDKEGRVDPLLVLKLAKMEYDIYLQKLILKKFSLRDDEGVVYFLKREGQISPIKIGRAKDVSKRISQLQTSLPCNLVLVGHIDTNNYVSLENKIHKDYQEKREKREWFSISEEEAIDIINSYSGVIDIT